MKKVRSRCSSQGDLPSRWQHCSTVVNQADRPISDAFRLSDNCTGMKRYEALAHKMAESIASGQLRPGDRVQSVREASRSHGVSPSTVFEAYYLLEARGLIEARPRSGYFVSHVVQQISHGRVLASTVSKVDELVVQIPGRLARNPWEIAAVCCSPLLAMARGAGLHPLPHGIREFSSQGCALVKGNKKQPPCKTARYR